MENKTRDHRRQSFGEEMANSVTHGAGLVGSLIITPFLIVAASRHAPVNGVVSAGIFGAAMIVMYAMSTLYHSFPESKAKRVFKLLDHCAIYILIAATYTPFTLVVLEGGLGWSMFGAVWGIAVLGIVFKVVWRTRHPLISTTIYLVMGWLILIAIKPLGDRLPLMGMIFLGTGGLAYSLGIMFYSAARLRYSHAVWHIFVLAGTGCHILAVMKYVI